MNVLIYYMIVIKIAQTKIAVMECMNVHAQMVMY